MPLVIAGFGCVGSGWSADPSYILRKTGRFRGRGVATATKDLYGEVRLGARRGVVSCADEDEGRFGEIPTMVNLGSGVLVQVRQLYLALKLSGKEELELRP